MQYQPNVGELVDEFGVSGKGEGEAGSGPGYQLLWVGTKSGWVELFSKLQHDESWFPQAAHTCFLSQKWYLKTCSKYAQSEWEKQGLQVGIAVLSYSVGSGKDTAFPIQLLQATHALNHLLSIGCNPSSTSSPVTWPKTILSLNFSDICCIQFPFLLPYLQSNYRARKEEKIIDQIQVFCDTKIKRYHMSAMLMLQDGGIHDDPLFLINQWGTL
ncbi:hypothetical protein J3R30DRAFT_3401566 [Lentinula aciculospora]|uniref:Uncharacterized protein n=1 Tax=Lentinula aciculospora TaxID=153920 RepID=A0A9W9APG1_9AGAR|nr:hypothetical protein J3R30DRAFT_3401566 [Lentinula aciculospora]